MPLLFKPGHISNDYLAGRRVRYVSPFRLFFFITVVAFFVAQFAFDIGDGNGADPVSGGKGIQEDPDLLKEGVFGSLPVTFFVLLPIFALLLKFAYLFKQRLYMEHLIVALHSHAFLSLALLLIALLSLLGDWSGWRVFSVFEGLLLLWMPIYLLLSQPCCAPMPRTSRR